MLSINIERDDLINIEYNIEGKEVLLDKLIECIECGRTQIYPNSYRRGSIYYFHSEYFSIPTYINIAEKNLFKVSTKIYLDLNLDTIQLLKEIVLKAESKVLNIGNVELNVVFNNEDYGHDESKVKNISSIRYINRFLIDCNDSGIEYLISVFRMVLLGEQNKYEFLELSDWSSRVAICYDSQYIITINDTRNFSLNKNEILDIITTLNLLRRELEFRTIILGNVHWDFRYHNIGN